MHSNEENRNKLKEEIIRILNLNTNKDFYSATDLIKVRQEEEKDKIIFFKDITKENPEIKKIELQRLSNNQLYISLLIKEMFKSKNLVLSYDSVNKIQNNPISYLQKNEDFVIWNEKKAKKLIDKYNNLINKLIEYGQLLTTSEKIKKLNTEYFKLHYNYLNTIINLNSLNNEFKYTVNLDEFKNLNRNLYTYYNYYSDIKELLNFNYVENLNVFLNNIQFKEEDVSDQLNKSLKKIKSNNIK